MLWHSVNPCFDIQNWTSSYRDQKSTIKRCKWKVSCDWLTAGHVITILASDWLKGVDVNCSLIFKTNPTDRGMCCTFNALAAEKIYRDSQVMMVMMLLRMLRIMIMVMLLLRMMIMVMMLLIMMIIVTFSVLPERGESAEAERV